MNLEIVDGGGHALVVDTTARHRIARFDGPQALAHAKLFVGCHAKVQELQAELTKLRAAHHHAVLAGGDALQQLNTVMIELSELKTEINRGRPRAIDHDPSEF